MKIKYLIDIIVLLAITCLIGLTAPALADKGDFTKVEKPFSIDQNVDGYKIPKGSIIHYLNNGTTEVSNSENQLILKATDSDATMIPTPEGFARATHVYQIPSNSDVSDHGNVTEVRENGNLILTIIDPNSQQRSSTSTKIDPNSQQRRSTPPKIDPNSRQQIPIASYSNWIESADSWAVSSVDYYYAYWTVPSTPPNTTGSNVAFIFNGIEPTSNDRIIQPVLEWNATTTNHIWTCAPWWVVTGGSYLYGTRISASVGNTIQGTMSHSGGQWTITVQNYNTGQSSSLTSSTIFGTSNLWLTAALEGRNINGNNDVCGDVAFGDMVYSYGGSPLSTYWQGNVRSGTGLTGLGVNVNFINPTTATLSTAN